VLGLCVILYGLAAWYDVKQQATWEHWKQVADVAYYKHTRPNRYRWDRSHGEHWKMAHQKVEEAAAAEAAALMAQMDEPNQPFRKDAWILDSGANAHISNHSKWFSKLFATGDVAAHATEKEGISISGQGTVQLPLASSQDLAAVDFEINNVHLAKDLRFNILSLSRLAKSVGMYGTWNVDEIILYTRDGQLFAKAPMKNGLYYLKLEQLVNNVNTLHQYDPVTIATINLNEKVWLWHRRLGHLGWDNMRKLLK
jgi:hypothetical protein